MAAIIEDQEPGTALRNPLDAFLGYQLRRASAAILADLSMTLADLALKPTDASILIMIEANPDITQSDIGRALGIQRANMAPLMATLQARHLVGSTKADGRSQALRLTPAGVATVKECRARIAVHEARFLPDVQGLERIGLIKRIKDIWTSYRAA